MYLWIELGVSFSFDIFYPRFQLAYYRQGRYEDFILIVENAGREASLNYDKVQSDQMMALDILAAHMVKEVCKMLLFYIQFVGK